MKIDWKTLSLAMIAAIVVTTLVGLLLSTVVYPHSPWDDTSQSSHSAATFAEAEGSGFNIHFVPIWMLIVSALFIVFILTGIFYFILNHKKEK